ncbi:MAG: MBL fold metallo-hydrolase, partial [Thermoplasmatota archaeon]
RDSKPGLVGEIIPALSYKISSGKESVVFSGDTGDWKTLADFIDGCDLAVVEATYAGGNEISDGVHLTVEQALKASAGATEVMLIHFTGLSREAYGLRNP